MYLESYQELAVGFDVDVFVSFVHCCYPVQGFPRFFHDSARVHLHMLTFLVWLAVIR